MANRYWVGGTNDWGGSANYWAATSNGAGGAGVPTSADDVFLDANSGVGTVTIAANASAKSLTCTGFAGTLTFQANRTLACYGNATFSSAMTVTITGSGDPSAKLEFAGGSANRTLNPAGKSLPNVSVNCAGYSVTLAGPLTSADPNGLALVAGTFDASSHNVSVRKFAQSAGTTLNMGSGAWTITGTAGTSAADWSVNSGATLNKQAARLTFSVTGTAPIFAGGGKSYPPLTLAGSSAGANVNIAGSNSFDDFRNEIYFSYTITFAGGTTNTFSKWSLLGSAGKTITITSSGTHYLAAVSGINAGDYLSLNNSSASPANYWFAGSHSSNVIGNSGWLFRDGPGGSGLFFGGVV